MSDIKTRLKSMAIVIKFSLPDTAQSLEDAADEIECLEDQLEACKLLLKLSIDDDVNIDDDAADGVNVGEVYRENVEKLLAELELQK